MRRTKLSFNKEHHYYTYEGKQLPGVTKIIGKRVGKNFPTGNARPAHLEEACDFGTNIHADVEEYLKNGAIPQHPAARYVCKYLEENFPKHRYIRASEVLVSDYENVATAIDIVCIDESARATIFDIKTGAFDRDYCSWQLGFGKMLLEMDGDIAVDRCIVLATKENFAYDISPRCKERCIALLKSR
jgi:hypothetical protein